MKKMYAVLVIFVSSIMVSPLPNVIHVKQGYVSIVQGDSTFVTGRISENTTWTLEGSPYIVVADVIVEPDVYLTVEPGVVVKFTNATNLVIDGGLFAHGNSTHKITFTSNATTPAPDDWKGIIVKSAVPTVQALFKHTLIEFAEIGISFTQVSYYIINNSTISNNGIYGIYLCNHK